jgi:hypothetical protein
MTGVCSCSLVGATMEMIHRKIPFCSGATDPEAPACVKTAQLAAQSPFLRGTIAWRSDIAHTSAEGRRGKTQMGSVDDSHRVSAGAVMAPCEQL